MKSQLKNLKCLKQQHIVYCKKFIMPKTVTLSPSIEL